MITEKYIENLFDDCCFAEEDIVSGALFSPIVHKHFFDFDDEETLLLSTDKLNMHKREIVNVLEAVPSNGNTVSLGQLRYQKNGAKWCYNDAVLEKYITLARVTNIICMSAIDIIRQLFDPINDKSDVMQKTKFIKEYTNYDSPVVGIKEYVLFDSIFAEKLTLSIEKKISKILSNSFINDEMKSSQISDLLNIAAILTSQSRDFNSEESHNVLPVLRLK